MPKYLVMSGYTNKITEEIEKKYGIISTNMIGDSSNGTEHNNYLYNMRTGKMDLVEGPMSLERVRETMMLQKTNIAKNNNFKDERTLKIMDRLRKKLKNKKK